ncbi:MAG: hypothetical protein H3C41_06890 [Bacteroidales bacterium]|nr:hypothetical protein [Bacteroidales bacterium]
MKLIAEAGSSKIEWLLVAKTGELKKTIETKGFNPNYHAKENLHQIVQQGLIPEISRDEVEQITYYGTGCTGDLNCDLVKNILQQWFPNVQVCVHSDLLAAAHGLLGRLQGVVCILGTGSNTCWYDGKDIELKVPSLGFMLGDEGSGTYIGMKFIRAVLNEELPSHIIQDYYRRNGLDFHSLIRKIYQIENPGNFFASAMPFVGEYISEPDCAKIVSRAFDDFITAQLSKYPGVYDSTVAFVGSVAFHFKELLNQSMVNHGFRKQAIVKQRLTEGLVSYHGGGCSQEEN